MDIQTAQGLFADFLQAENLRADQITFIDRIIQFLTKNGKIEKKMLFEPPFTDIHDEGVIGVFDKDMGKVTQIISIIEKVNLGA